MSDSPAPPPTDSRPPTTLGYAPPPPQQTGWPRPLGIVAIVFGAIGAGGGGCAIFGQALAPMFQKIISQAQPKGATAPNPFEAMEAYAIPSLITGIATIAIGTLLLIAGIGIVQRRAWSLKTVRLWAVLKILLAISNACLGWLMQSANSAAISNAGGLPPGLTPGLMNTFAAFGVVIGILWAWALPIFMLVWFNRAAVRTETETWK